MIRFFFSLHKLLNLKCHENKKYPLEMKESLLIMTDRPSMNANVISAALCLLE